MSHLKSWHLTWRSVLKTYGAVLAVAGVALLAASCGTDKEASPTGPAAGGWDAGPQFGLTDEPNGVGQCLQADTDAGNLTSGAGSLNCTSEDIDIAFSSVSEYSFTGAGGPFETLDPGETIGCTQGQTIWVRTAATLQNNANERYDVGLWIANNGGPDALNGAQCLHYNLVTGAPGVADLDGDACGDIDETTGFVTVELDVLQVQCSDPDEDGFVQVGACAAWQNSVDGEDRICPDDLSAVGFRYQTTPETKAKCKCDPLNLPIEIKSILRVVKVTNPDGDPTEFTFTPGGWNSNATFTRSDNQAAFSSEPLSNGTYTVAETVPTGWALTNRACVITGTATAKTFSTISNGISVDLENGEDITCTFTNTKQARIRVDKVTDPAADPTSFTFTPTGFNGGSTFGLTDAATPFVSGYLAPGVVSVAETVPSGWTLQTRACVHTGTSDAANFSNSGSNGVSVTLAAGDDVTCTFTNRLQRGQLRIAKATLPDGDPTNFTFTPGGWNGDATFMRADNQAAFASGDLLPGTYTATETVPSGWALTGRACVLTGTATAKTFSTIANGVSVTLAPNEDVTCTFTNTKQAQLRIAKATLPDGDATNFTFSPTGGWNSGSDFQRADNQAAFASGFLTPGTYGATETVPSGWDLTGRACVLTGTATAKTFSSPSNGVSVDLDPGEDVTCTFTNTKRAQLRIAKATTPDGDPTNFTFTPGGWNGDATFTRADNEAAFGSGLIVPGTYTATETVPSAWVLTNRACVLTGTATAKTFSSPANGVSVDLNPGEDVTCTFTDQRKARLIVTKTVVGGGTQSFDFTRNPGGASFSLVNGGSNDTGYSLLPDTYRVCENDLAVTWNATATVDAAPAALINPDFPEDFGNRCVDVTLAYGDSKTVAWTNNPPPGGDARTIGYWKNWSSCSNGQQYPKALAAGMLDKTLDGNLPQTIGDLVVDTCAKGVAILDKRDLNGRKRASDAAYNLAAQLLAAKLNFSAGAGTCPAATTAANEAQALLDGIDFDGTGQYLRPKDGALYTQANDLAATLDSYNNNTLCP